MAQTTLVTQQFGATAAAYLSSAVHAQGEDLARLTRVAHQSPGLSALDIGCGAGHASFALAAGGARVSACDPTAPMLAVVADEARRRGHETLSLRQGVAECLPFADACFDLAVTRFSAHHWTDVAAGLREARRVLKPGGSLIVVDIVAPDAPLCDTIVQTVELLRDPSHVRDYRIAEWKTALDAAGFATPDVETWRLRMDFASWTARMRTPPAQVQAIRGVLARAPEAARRYFGVGEDDSFDLDAAWIRTRRRGAA